MYRIRPSWFMKNYVDLKGCYRGNLCRHTQPTNRKQTTTTTNTQQKQKIGVRQVLFMHYENFITLKNFNTL